MSLHYTKEQTDAQAAIIGSRIKTATNPETLAAKIDALPDRNILTDAERTKLSGLESSRFLGTFLTPEAIPTVGAKAGSYADVDAGEGGDTERYIFDVDSGKFVKSVSVPAGETSATIKEKYEANPNTNAFTDAHKMKLDGIQEAADITDFTAALDGALV